jgi:hypothetical protein
MRANHAAAMGDQRHHSRAIDTSPMGTCTAHASTNTA